MKLVLVEVIVILQFILKQFIVIGPYWFAGIVVGSAVSTFARGKIGNASFSLGKGIPSIIGASLLGVASPMCMFGTIPMIAVLGRKGMPQHVLISFMVSSVMLNPNLFIMSFALGAPIAIIRLTVSILGGIIAGLLTLYFLKNQNLMNYLDTQKKSSYEKTSKIKELISECDKIIRISFPYMFVGFVITALSERYIPDALLANLFGHNNPWGVLIAATIGVPMYLCGGGTIPIINSWLGAGMSIGSAIAFMTSGPATKMSNLAALKIVFKGKAFIMYIAYVLIYSIIVGMLIELFM